MDLNWDKKRTNVSKNVHLSKHLSKCNMLWSLTWGNNVWPRNAFFVGQFGAKIMRKLCMNYMKCSSILIIFGSFSQDPGYQLLASLRVIAWCRLLKLCMCIYYIYACTFLGCQLLNRELFMVNNYACAFQACQLHKIFLLMSINFYTGFMFQIWRMFWKISRNNINFCCQL